MLKITLKQLKNLGVIDEVRILSLEPSLYTVRIDARGDTYRLVNDNGQPYNQLSLKAIKDTLSELPVKKVFLEHHSACDEMLGQSDIFSDTGINPKRPITHLTDSQELHWH